MAETFGAGPIPTHQQITDGDLDKITTFVSRVFERSLGRPLTNPEVEEINGSIFDLFQDFAEDLFDRDDNEEDYEYDNEEE